MDKIQKPDNTNCWQGCKTTGAFIFAGGNAKWYSQYGKQAVSYKARHLSNDLTILLLDI